MPITDVIRDKGSDTSGDGGAVFNVKAYGALGTALGSPLQDDTAAFQAAITAAAQVMGTDNETATSTRGSVVFVPYGAYRITSTLNLPSGVSLRGAGMRTTQIRFAMTPDDDGLVWDAGTDTTFHVGGFLEDIDVIAEGASDTTTAKRLVVLDNWTDFAFNRVRVLGARTHNVCINNCVAISAFHLYSRSGGQSNLYIGADSGTVTTTCRFVACYFQASRNAPAVDVAGLGITFDGCVFENSGTVTAAQGMGARVRGGTVTFVAPYFEANRSWDLISGTDTVSTNNPAGPSVAVINPVFTLGPDGKVTGTGGVRVERGSATLLGGKYGHVPNPLVMTKVLDMVHVAADFYPGVPAVEAGTFADIPGTVLYKDPPTGQAKQAGDVVYGVNP